MIYPVQLFTDCPNDDTLLLSIINLLNGNEIKGGNNMAKMPDGVCNICGNYGKLSFEHVPPKGAFNDRPVIKGISKILLVAYQEKRLKDEFNRKELAPTHYVKNAIMIQGRITETVLLTGLIKLLF